MSTDEAPSFVDLTGTAAFDALSSGRCPDCDGAEFIGGPRGGLAQNIECMKCRARFNVTRYARDLVFAQRIPGEADGGSPWPIYPEAAHMGAAMSFKLAEPPAGTRKIFTVAHVPDELARLWVQHVRDFDVAHPGCHFEVGIDGPDMPLTEMVKQLIVDPALTFSTIFDRARKK